MIVWIILVALLVFPWVAPALERVCSRYAGFQPTSEHDAGSAANAVGGGYGHIEVSGHLRRAKAEGVGQPRTSSSR